MKQIKSVEEIEGKTIATVFQYFDELWLRFTDGDFVWLRATHSYGDTELETVSKEADLGNNSQAFLALELATPKQVEIFQAEAREKQQAAMERREKQQLAELLAKYPRQ